MTRLRQGSEGQAVMRQLCRAATKSSEAPEGSNG